MQSPGAIEALSKVFYDSIATDYDRMLATPAATAIRECFWLRAEAALPPPARLLDFGAGSGIDAEHFAALGHRVTAYEPSEGMLVALRDKCAAHVAEGKVVPVSGTLGEAYEALAAQAPFDAILCNFAVFSMIPKLRPIFRLFGELTRPGSTIFIAIQNPWYPPDMRVRTFWKALLAMPFAGVMRYPSVQLGHTYRHTPTQVRRAARPEFIADRAPAPDCCTTQFGRRSPFRLVALARA